VQKGLVQIAAAMLSGNRLRQTVHTRRTSVHQAAKLVAAVLRVARVTARLAESNGSRFMTYATCRLTAKNRDQLPDPMFGNRVWATFTFLCYVCVRVVWLYRLLSCLALHCGESSAADVGCQLLLSINDVTRVSCCVCLLVSHSDTMLTTII